MGKVKDLDGVLRCDGCREVLFKPDQKFCHECGNNLSMLCDSCYWDIIPGQEKMVVCPNCAQPFERVPRRRDLDPDLYAGIYY